MKTTMLYKLLFSTPFFFQKGKDKGRSKCLQSSTNYFMILFHEVSVNFHLKKTKLYPFLISVTTVGATSAEAHSTLM